MKTPAVLLAIALLAAPGLVPVTAAGEPARTLVAAGRAVAAQHPPSEPAGDASSLFQIYEYCRGHLMEALATVSALVGAGYRRAPTLVMVLSALLLLPTVALMSWLIHAAGRRKAHRAAIRAARRRSKVAERTRIDGAIPTSHTIPAWMQQAWLTVEGGAATLPLATKMVRIGRHEDNDVRLPDTSVHRYHAVIERTTEAEFVITDLSGKDGNGVRINGERMAKAHLADGDLIELGRTRLKFESAAV